jgi:hypothetical protein
LLIFFVPTSMHVKAEGLAAGPAIAIAVAMMFDAPRLWRQRRQRRSPHNEPQH